MPSKILQITSIILMGAVLFGVQSTATHGYRQVINHNNHRLWTSHPANSYQFHYSNHGSTQNRKSSHGLKTQISNPHWNNLLYTPMKTAWQNNVLRSQWQSKTPVSKRQNQIFKYKFRDTKSKPQYPKNAQMSPLPSGYIIPKSKSLSRANAAAQRDWPAYIPPITMIKLPRDTPPDP